MVSLDQLYLNYANAEAGRSDALDRLLQAVRTKTLKITGGDEDLAQQVLMQVHSGLSRFQLRHRASFSGWVHTLIHFSEQSARKAVNRRREKPLPLAENPVQEPTYPELGILTSELHHLPIC